MRIECPGCEAAYEVPEAQMRPGRSVRCACCDVLWLPVPEPVMAMSQPVAMAAPEAAAPEAPAEIVIPEPPAIEEAAGTAEADAGRVRLRQSAAPKPAAASSPAPIARFGMRLALPAGAMPWLRSSLRPWGLRPWWLGWATSVVVLLALLLAAGHWRTAIMQGWPPSIRLYTALGSPPPT